MFQICRGVRISELQRVAYGKIPDIVRILFEQHIAALIVRECEKFLKVSASEKNRVSGDQKIVAGDARRKIAKEEAGEVFWSYCEKAIPIASNVSRVSSG